MVSNYCYAVLSEKKIIFNLEDIKLSFSLFSFHNIFLPQIYVSHLFIIVCIMPFTIFLLLLPYNFANHCSKISDTIILYWSYKILGI